MFPIPCILWSILSVLTTMFLAEVLRKSVGGALQEGMLKNAALEFVAAAEMCGCAFELIISKTRFNCCIAKLFNCGTKRANANDKYMINDQQMCQKSLHKKAKQTLEQASKIVKLMHKLSHFPAYLEHFAVWSNNLIIYFWEKV